MRTKDPTENLEEMEYDDWLFKSIKTYKNLSMYDLQHGITAADWVNGKGLCAATSSGCKNEICELSLPDKVLQDSHNSKIKKDRDFRVLSGGFSQQLVTEIKHLPSSRFCIVAQQDGCASVWEMGNEETDLMREYKPITESFQTDYTIKIALGVDKDVRKLAIGSSINNIRMLDPERFVMIGHPFVSDEEYSGHVTSLQYLSNDSLLCCKISGDIVIIDTRSQNCVKQHRTCGKSAHYWTMSNILSQSNTLLQISSEGEVIQLDKRYLNDCVTKSDIGLSTRCNFGSVCIQESQGGKRFSVSGFDGCVYLYNLKSDQSERRDIEPVFLHEGHVMNTDSKSDHVLVSKHLWHPWIEDLVISCGSDGSMHAWQWNEDSRVL